MLIRVFSCTYEVCSTHYLPSNWSTYFSIAAKNTQNKARLASHLFNHSCLIIYISGWLGYFLMCSFYSNVLCHSRKVYVNMGARRAPTNGPSRFAIKASVSKFAEILQLIRKVVVFFTVFAPNHLCFYSYEHINYWPVFSFRLSELTLTLKYYIIEY